MIAMTIQITETSHLKFWNGQVWVGPGRSGSILVVRANLGPPGQFLFSYRYMGQVCCILNLNGRLQVFFFGFLIEIWFEFFEPLFLKFCKFKQSVINFMWYFNNANISLVKQFIHVFQFSSAIFMLLPQMIWKSWLSFSSSSYDIGGSRLECSNLKPPIEKNMYYKHRWLGINGPICHHKHTKALNAFYEQALLRWVIGES